MQDSNSRPMRFLLIEDDDDHAFLVNSALEENHVVNHVDRVADGAEAIEYLFERVKTGRQPCPDVILLDLKLPKVDGHEILRQLKEDAVLKTIPVVVLTTSDAEADRLRAYRSYANSYLSKPLDFDKFHQMILALNLYWAAWNRPSGELSAKRPSSST